MTRRSTWQGRLGALALLAGTCLVGVGVHLLTAPPALTVQEQSTHADDGGPAVDLTAPGQAAAAPIDAAPAESPPVELRADGIGVSGPVVPVLAAPGGALIIPEDPATFGWWAAGATPSAPAGSVVIVAHVDAVSYGAGPMSALLRAALPTRVTVVDASGRAVVYSLTERSSLPKDELPTDLFSLGGAPRLVLITCGGTFDARSGHYSDNVVMVGAPVT